MKKHGSVSAGGSGKQSLWLLVSTAAALCLFLVPTKITILLEAAIFMATALHAFLNRAGETQPADWRAIFLAAVFDGIGLLSFRATWTPSSLMARVAELVHLPKEYLILGIAAVGCIAAFYAFFRLSCWIIGLIKGQFSALLSENALRNLKANWYFPLSALAFFLLEAEPPTMYGYSVLAAFAALIVMASMVGSLWDTARKNHWVCRLLADLSGLGICCFRQEAFPGWGGILAAAAAFPFLYVCISCFFGKLAAFFKEHGVFAGVKKREVILYGVLLGAALVFATAAFLSSDAFYGTPYSYDIIYTSDSPMLVQDNAYLALAYKENDLRQPLFAVFAAPFMGIPYLLSRVVSASPAVNALLMNYVQIGLLFLATFLLSRMLGLSAGKRMGFMGVFSVSYMNLLSVLMMEQYIVAYFYLILVLFSVCAKKPEKQYLWGAGGTLLPSLILLPTLSGRHPVREFKVWFREMLDRAMEFVVVMLVFSRLDVLLDIASNVVRLGQFSGEKLTLFDKLCQFTAFIPGCLFAPAAGVAENLYGVLSWQLDPINGLSWAGIGILLMVLGSAVLNWDKASSRAAAGWVLFSFVMLFGLGWGTQENGLILYALYFGWAYLALLFQLAEKLGDMLQVKLFLPAVIMIAIAAMAIINLPAIGEVLRFAVSYFPL